MSSSIYPHPGLDVEDEWNGTSSVDFSQCRSRRPGCLGRFAGPLVLQATFHIEAQGSKLWNNSGPPHPSSSSWYRSRTVGDRLVSSILSTCITTRIARNFRSISTHHQRSPGVLCWSIKVATMTRKKPSQTPSVSYNIDVLSESLSRVISCCFSKRPCSRPVVRTMRWK